jgi:hypothetical protein
LKNGEAAKSGLGTAQKKIKKKYRADCISKYLTVMIRAIIFRTSRTRHEKKDDRNLVHYPSK